MARNGNFDDIRKQRELEDQEDEAIRDARKAGVAIAGKSGFSHGKTGDSSTDKLLELFARCEPLIEQLNNLYNQYIAGVETHPPLERRKQLDTAMATMTVMNKPSPSYQFRFSTLNASYLTHRDRWDRLIKDLESGKIKRVAGPRRRTG